jgi:hypothetical protein
MSFVQRKGWFCQFLEPDLQTAFPRRLSFSDVEKVRERAKRGGGFTDLESAAPRWNMEWKPSAEECG